MARVASVTRAGSGVVATVLALVFSVFSAAAQEQGESDLAKQSQNPIGNLVSLPFQNNTSFGIGPNDAISNVLNIQPVYPVGLSKQWNLINRGIVPVIYREAIFSEIGGSASGLGDISYTGFVSPAGLAESSSGASNHWTFRCKPSTTSKSPRRGSPRDPTWRIRARPGRYACS